MGRMNKGTYQQIINEDIEAVKRTRIHSLTKAHIIAVLKQSIKFNYKLDDTKNSKL